jgi:putative FmdB family regulatory protein
MPLYQYSCMRCEVVHAEIRTMSERDRPVQCSQCGSDCARDLFPGSNVMRHSAPTSSALATPVVRPTAISVAGPMSLTIENSSFSNAKRGIVAHEGAQISMRNVKFQNVEVPVERRGE